jgi:hypothetical protein
MQNKRNVPDRNHHVSEAPDGSDIFLISIPFLSCSSFACVCVCVCRVSLCFNSVRRECRCFRMAGERERERETDWFSLESDASIVF